MEYPSISFLDRTDELLECPDDTIAIVLITSAKAGLKENVNE
jgi:hypothetical protein